MYFINLSARRKVLKISRDREIRVTFHPVVRYVKRPNLLLSLSFHTVSSREKFLSRTGKKKKKIKKIENKKEGIVEKSGIKE